MRSALLKLGLALLALLVICPFGASARGLVYVKTFEREASESEPASLSGGLYTLEDERPRRITRDPSDRDPDVSRTGKIAFAREGDIYLTDYDGSEARQVTAGPAIDEKPLFSPDGNSLLFTRRAAEGAPRDLFIVPLGGLTLPIPLTATPADDSEADFAPDGRSIAFVAREPGATVPSGDVYSVRPDGSGLARLTATAGAERHPLYVAGGLCFDRQRAGRPMAIFITRRDGSGAKPLVALDPGASLMMVTPNRRLLAYRSRGVFWALPLSGRRRGVARKLMPAYGARSLVPAPDNRHAAFLLYFDEVSGIAILNLVRGGLDGGADNYNTFDGTAINPYFGW